MRLRNVAARKGTGNRIRVDEKRRMTGARGFAAIWMCMLVIVTMAAGEPNTEKATELGEAAKRQMDHVNGTTGGNGTTGVNGTETVPNGNGTTDRGRVLQEVKFVDGKADASSRYSQYSFKPGWAFRIDSSTARSEYFASGKNKHGTGDWKPFPHLIWYDFGNRSIVPARVGIRGYYVDSGTEYGATMWEFIGSNDVECGKYSRWTVLCGDWSDKKFQRKTQIKYCDVDPWITASFRCLGINALNSALADRDEVVISSIRMWKNANPQ